MRVVLIVMCVVAAIAGVVGFPNEYDHFPAPARKVCLLFWYLCVFGLWSAVLILLCCCVIVLV